jgi:hypothetical protein
MYYSYVEIEYIATSFSPTRTKLAVKLLMLSLIIAKWRDLLNSQSLVYDGDRQAPPDLLNLLPEETDSNPDTWLMRHKSIPAFPRRNASASSNRRSFGSKRYF